MIWALGHAQRVPDKQWVDEFLKATFHKMLEFNTQGLGNIAWALARLDLHPPPAWQYSYVAAVRRYLGSGSLRAIDLAQIIEGLRKLNTTMQLQKVGYVCGVMRYCRLFVVRLVFVVCLRGYRSREGSVSKLKATELTW